MKEFVKVMKALSDPNRVKIIKMLHLKSLCVCEIQAGLGIAQPTVSNNLKVLEDAGLVIYRKSGLGSITRFPTVAPARRRHPAWELKHCSRMTLNCHLLRDSQRSIGNSSAGENCIRIPVSVSAHGQGRRNG